MPAIGLQLLRVDDPPPFPIEPEQLIAQFRDEKWELVLIEHGMASGQPSVALSIQKDGKFIFAETSLVAFLAAARGLRGMAEARLGWQEPM